MWCRVGARAHLHLTLTWRSTVTEHHDPSPSAHAIASLLHGFSGTEVLRTAAGLRLRLLPEHAHMLSQLEALTLAACVTTPKDRRPGRDEYEQLLTSTMLCEDPVTLWDDPYEHHFTELFDFDGEPSLVFPGATTGGTSVLASLVGGLRLKFGHPPARFLQSASTGPVESPGFKRGAAGKR